MAIPTDCDLLINYTVTNSLFVSNPKYIDPNNCGELENGKTVHFLVKLAQKFCGSQTLDHVQQTPHVEPPKDFQLGLIVFLFTIACLLLIIFNGMTAATIKSYSQYLVDYISNSLKYLNSCFQFFALFSPLKQIVDAIEQGASFSTEEICPYGVQNHPFTWNVEKIGTCIIRCFMVTKEDPRLQRKLQTIYEKHCSAAGNYQSCVEQLTKYRNNFSHFFENIEKEPNIGFNSFAEWHQSIQNSFDDPHLAFISCMILVATELEPEHIFWTNEGGDYQVIYDLFHTSAYQDLTYLGHWTYSLSKETIHAYHLHWLPLFIFECFTLWGLFALSSSPPPAPYDIQSSDCFSLSNDKQTNRAFQIAYTLCDPKVITTMKNNVAKMDTSTDRLIFCGWLLICLLFVLSFLCLNCLSPSWKRQSKSHSRNNSTQQINKQQVIQPQHTPPPPPPTPPAIVEMIKKAEEISAEKKVDFMILTANLLQSMEDSKERLNKIIVPIYPDCQIKQPHGYSSAIQGLTGGNQITCRSQALILIRDKSYHVDSPKNLKYIGPFQTIPNWSQHICQEFPDLFICCVILTATILPHDHIFWTHNNSEYADLQQLFHGYQVRTYANEWKLLLPNVTKDVQYPMLKLRYFTFLLFLPLVVAFVDEIEDLPTVPDMGMDLDMDLFLEQCVAIHSDSDSENESDIGSEVLILSLFWAIVALYSAMRR